jgi:hypothetical protein
VGRAGASVTFAPLSLGGALPRGEAGLAVERGRERVVLIGGCSNGFALGDVWELDGDVFVEQPPADVAPPAPAYV